VVTAPNMPAVYAVDGSVCGARNDFTTVGTADSPRAAMPIAIATSPVDRRSSTTAAPASARHTRSTRVARQ
jgi:hypothetical protein